MFTGVQGRYDFFESVSFPEIVKYLVMFYTYTSYKVQLFHKFSITLCELFSYKLSMFWHAYNELSRPFLVGAPSQECCHTKRSQLAKAKYLHFFRVPDYGHRKSFFFSYYCCLLVIILYYFVVILETLC